MKIKLVLSDISTHKLVKYLFFTRLEKNNYIMPSLCEHSQREGMTYKQICTLIFLL